MTRAHAALIAAGWVCMCAALRAEEFVFLQKTYDHGKETESYLTGRKAPFENGDAPLDWTGPDNYKDGTWQLRVEVLQKPTDRPVRYQVFWMNRPAGQDADRNHRVTPSRKLRFSGTGTYTASGEVQKMGQFVRKGGKKKSWNWRRAWDRCYAKVYADGSGRGSGQMLPMRIRVTVVIVSSGAEFSGWENYPEEGKAERN